MNEPCYLVNERWSNTEYLFFWIFWKKEEKGLFLEKWKSTQQQKFSKQQHLFVLRISTWRRSRARQTWPLVLPAEGPDRFHDGQTSARHCIPRTHSPLQSNIQMGHCKPNYESITDKWTNPDDILMYKTKSLSRTRGKPHGQPRIEESTASKIWPLRLATGTPLFLLRYRFNSGTLPCTHKFYMHGGQKGKNSEEIIHRSFQSHVIWHRYCWHVLYYTEED